MFTKKLAFVVLFLSLCLWLCTPATAVLVFGPTPFPNLPSAAAWDGTPAAHARDGSTDGTSWYNQVFLLRLGDGTNGVASFGEWPTSVDIPFAITWKKSTGKLSFLIEPDNNYININGTFDDFINNRFRFIRVNLGGDPVETVSVSNVKVNNFLLGSAGPFNTNNYFYLYNPFFIPFGDLTITGLLNFSAVGADGDLEFPRFEVAFGGPVANPLPPSVLLMGSGLLGLAALGWRRRKRD